MVEANTHTVTLQSMLEAFVLVAWIHLLYSNFLKYAPSTTLQLHYKCEQNQTYITSAMQCKFELYTTMKPWPKNTMMWWQIKWLITKNPSTCLCCALTNTYQYDGPWSPLWQDQRKLAGTKDQKIKLLCLGQRSLWLLGTAMKSLATWSLASIKLYRVLKNMI